MVRVKGLDFFKQKLKYFGRLAGRIYVLGREQGLID
jgi:hypothetical protein